LGQFTALSVSNDDHELVISPKGASLKSQAHFRGRLIEIFAPAHARRQHKLAAEAFVQAVERALELGDPALMSRFAHTDKLDSQARLILVDAMRDRLASQLSGAHALTAHDVQDVLSELSHQLTGVSYLQLSGQACAAAKALSDDLRAKGVLIDKPEIGNRYKAHCAGGLADEDLAQAHSICKDLCDAFDQLKPNLHLHHYIGDLEQTALMLVKLERSNDARDLLDLVQSIRARQTEVESFDGLMKALFRWLSSEIDGGAPTVDDCE
jgi:hypothetical protein